MGESEIQRAIKDNYNHDYVLLNNYVFDWESDYFGVSKAGLIYDIEIKISMRDFRRDFYKEHRHFSLKNAKKELAVIPKDERFRYDNSMNKEMLGYCPLVILKVRAPHKFFYAVPQDIAGQVLEEIPKYAGLISVEPNRDIMVLKNAPVLHKKNMSEWMQKVLFKKFYYHSLDLERKLKEAKNDLNSALESFYYK